VEFSTGLDALLVTHELQYLAATAAVAVLVLFLLRRRAGPASVVLYVIGACLTVLGAPLLEAAFSVLDRAIANGNSRSIDAGFWRVLLIGLAAAGIGMACMARAWRAAPER
jgi:hypothetical protein